MMGLNNLPLNKLTTAFMVLSAAMVIFAATAPYDSPSTTMLGVWVVVALVLIGVWIATAYEIYKRFFGRDDSPGETGRRTRQQ